MNAFWYNEKGIHVLAGLKYSLTNYVSPPITLARKEETCIFFIQRALYRRDTYFVYFSYLFVQVKERLDNCDRPT